MVGFTGVDGSPTATTAGAATAATAAAATAATAATAAPAASPTTTKTYRNKYTMMTDILQGNYTTLYDRWSMTSSSTNEELRDHVVNTQNVIPKVFVCLLEGKEKEPLMTVLHRPFKYIMHPTKTSEWDGNVFCFIGDLMRGDNIIARQLPPEAFEVTGTHKVPKLAGFDAQLASLPATKHHLPLPARNAATDELQSRYLVPIPHKYVPLAMSLHARKATPKVWWTELGGTIIADRKEGETKILFDFLRLSCVHQSNDPTEDCDPGTMMGTKDHYFPPLEIDEDLNDCIHDVILSDFPSVNPITTSIPGSEGLATVMREEHALNRAQREQERQEQATKEASKKKPSFVFPNAHTRWMRNCNVTDESHLEPFYTRWAAIKQGERRPELQNAVDSRALEATSAGKRAPIITKELFDMTLKGCLGARDIDILTEGVSPFTCGFIVGSKPEVSARVNDYDISMQGLAGPTIGEQRLFSTKEIPLPTTTYHAGAMMRSTSVFLG